MHSQADPDAIGSAVALCHLIEYLNPTLSIKTLEPDFSTLGKKLLNKINFHFDPIEIHQLSSPLFFILIDTYEIDSSLNNSENHIAILDHHIPTTLKTEITYDFRLVSFKATAEIIASLYYHAKISLTSKVIMGILAGIIFDTRRFLYADKELFNCIDYLLNDNPEIYPEIIQLFSSFRSYSEKRACIKAAQRMKQFQINDKILLISQVSSFEAAAARSLIFLGGDVVAVIAIRKKETRISLRSTPEFHIKTGISLGKDIIPALIAEYGGTGGGHDGAAGYNTREQEFGLVKNYLFRLFMNKLNS
jgi:nanoRNase/pAp phosphatase (c-di-AMP/oligoRNAs hydrolase)